VNGDSIYGTSSSPLHGQPAWGRITQDGHKLYLHIFNWPADGKLVVNGVRGKNPYFLADTHKKKLPVLSSGASAFGEDSQTTIDLPAQPLDAIDTVVVLKI
jgi:alpha-L-fucosidase